MKCNIIRGIAATAIFIAAPLSVASAADMPLKAPPPPPPPVYSWTGFYAGVNAGVGLGNFKTDFDDVAPLTVTNNTGASATFPASGLAGSNRQHANGFIGGGQIGYNWQVSPIWVVGLEADFQGAAQRGSDNFSNPFNATSTNGVNTFVGTTTIDYTTKLEWFGTARGRIGYVWGNGNVLTYVTGGLAYGKVDLQATNLVSGTVNGVAQVLDSQAFNHSRVNAGYVAGVGTEGGLGARNWTWKIEGLFMDLGTLNSSTGASMGGTFPVIPPNGVTITSNGGGASVHTSFTDIIVRAGLNYQFH